VVEGGVIATFGGGFAGLYSRIVTVIVDVGPFTVVCNGLRFLLLIGQRRSAADSLKVVKVHCAEFLLGCLGQDRFLLMWSLLCTGEMRCVGEADYGGEGDQCEEFLHCGCRLRLAALVVSAGFHVEAGDLIC
jgi:hypothetical protein